MDFAIAAGSLFSYSKLADGAKAVRTAPTLNAPSLIPQRRLAHVHSLPPPLLVAAPRTVTRTEMQGDFKLSSSSKKDKAEPSAAPAATKPAPKK